MKLSTAVSLMGARAGNQPELPHREFFDNEITGFALDSRACAPGELFFALSSEDLQRHCFTDTSAADAHRFIPGALERGALAAVARAARVAGDRELEPHKERLLLVDDVIEALQMLARGVLKHWGGPVIGITGSAGKTTTKDLTAHVLGVNGKRVLRSRKNFNNELGVALSILQMESDGARPENFDVAVLEMGMSLPGEIARHCLVAQPDIAVVLTVAPVHLEFMGSIEAIAAGKAQLVEGLRPNGIAVLNADDQRVAAMRSKHTGRIVTYGIDNQADVTATDIYPAGLGLTKFQLRTPLGIAAAELPMPGRHNLTNALASAAVASCFEISPDEIARALLTAAPSQMRGEVLRFAEGFTVVDDSYNSNPRSLLAMAEAIAQGANISSGGSFETSRRIVVAGEMLELGADSTDLHREVGRDIAGLGIDVVWGVRGHALALVEGAREAGMPEASTAFFESSEEAGEALLRFAQPGDLILIKGSRGVHTEAVVKRLKEQWTMSGDEPAANK